MTTQYTRPGATPASSTVSDLANTAQDKIAETVDQAQALAQDQYDKLVASIRRNPLQAAGIAAGIGFVARALGAEIDRHARGCGPLRGKPRHVDRRSTTSRGG